MNGNSFHIQDSISLGRVIRREIIRRVEAENNYDDVTKYLRAIQDMARDDIPIRSHWSETIDKTAAYDELCYVIGDLLVVSENCDFASVLEGRDYANTVEHYSALIAHCLMKMCPVHLHWEVLMRRKELC